MNSRNCCNRSDWEKSWKIKVLEWCVWIQDLRVKEFQVTIRCTMWLIHGSKSLVRKRKSPGCQYVTVMGSEVGTTDDMKHKKTMGVKMQWSGNGSRTKGRCTIALTDGRHLLSLVTSLLQISSQFLFLHSEVLGPLRSFLLFPKNKQGKKKSEEI